VSEPTPAAARNSTATKSKQSTGKLRDTCSDEPFAPELAALNHQEIRKEVARILDKLPRRFREQLHNLEIVVEERPSEELLRSEGLDPRCDTLYGIYEGIPLPERSVLDLPLLPDKITIFAEPLLEDFPDPQELREEIRLTVIHEIAHYFGMDDDEIEDLGY
jgi:predicted Zn-dependent protease with MMP-like domain